MIVLHDVDTRRLCPELQGSDRLRCFCILFRYVGPLSQPATERNVLARDLVELDHEIIGEIPAAATTPSFKAFNNPRRFSFGRPEMKVISNRIKIVRIFEVQERRRMEELASRQDVNDLEEVVRRNAEHAHEPILNRP